MTQRVEKTGEGARTHHSHSLRVDHLHGAKRGEISQVGQNIDGSHYGQGDDDGAGKVPEEGSQVTQTARPKLCRQAKAAILTYRARSSPL